VKLLNFLLLILASLSTSAQTFDFFSNEKWVMQHKIKSVVGTAFTLNNGTPVLPGKKSCYKKFNDLGMLLENVNYSAGGEATREETNVLDASNVLNEIRLYEAHKSFTSKVYFKKTSVGTIGEKLIVKPNKAFEKYIYKYNSKLQLIAYDLYDSEFGYSHLKYVYDVNLNIINLNEYDSYNALYNSTTFKYNDKIQLTDCISIDADNEIDYKYSYTYYADGNVEWQTTYNRSGEAIQITKFNYDFY
jgi:hypothetical protein